MTALTTLDNTEYPRRDDPSQMAWPPTLPIEVALRAQPIRDICAEYGITRDEWDVIRLHPVFMREVAAALEMLKKDGMPFRVRCQMQSMEMLKESWRMVHAGDDRVPPAVKADLIKATVKWAGYDPSTEKGGSQGAQNLFQIQINLRDWSASNG